MFDFLRLEEYYKILGVDSSVNDEQLKKAYRKLALRYHPDLASGNEAHFKKIVQAYETVVSFRKAKDRLKTLNAADKAVLYEHLKAKAAEKAKAKARQRAAAFKAEKIAEQNRAYRQAIYALVAILMLAYFSFKAYHWYIDWQINRNPAKTFATVVGIERNRVVYEFEVNQELIVERSYVSGFGLQMFADNGMPLKTGDQFSVDFRADKPAYHRLNYYQISSKTFNRYIKLAADALWRSTIDPMHPEDWLPVNKSRCMALLIYDRDGLNGLAKLYHFDTNPLNKLSHNRLGWYLYRNGEAMEWAQSECKFKLD